MVQRSALVALAALWGYYAGSHISGAPIAPWIGLVAGIVLGAVVIVFERTMGRASFWELLGGICGLILGLIVSNLLTFAFFSDVASQSELLTSVGLIFHAVFGYLGVELGMKKIKELDLKRFKIFAKTQVPEVDYKILDTSVIIDGRIFDICETGFIEGTLVIPQFVLQELMRIADSADPLRNKLLLQ